MDIFQSGLHHICCDDASNEQTTAKSVVIIFVETKDLGKIEKRKSKRYVIHNLYYEIIWETTVCIFYSKGQQNCHDIKGMHGIQRYKM